MLHLQGENGFVLVPGQVLGTGQCCGAVAASSSEVMEKKICRKSLSFQAGKETQKLGVVGLGAWGQPMEEGWGCGAASKKGKFLG